MQGKTLIERTSNMAKDVRYYRDIINMAPNEETQKSHNKYIHQTGAEMLKIQTSEVQLTPQEIALQKKLRGKPKLQRREIKVADMDDGGHSITIDLEWDTSTWGDAELQAGVDALIGVFETECSQDRREQAVRMLMKLLDRHEVAIKQMRENIQPVMNRAISKRLIGGASAAALNLLYVLHCSKNHYYFELSSASYIGHFFDMMLVEAKLAATLIQHSFRTFREMRSTRMRPMRELARGWGSETEAARARQRSVNLRSGELRTKWKLMHMAIRKNEKNILYGMKGPVHMMVKYTILGLETVEFLVSNRSKELAHRNREDVVYSHGVFLLSTFVATTRSAMSQLSLRVMHHVSLSVHALPVMLRTGCISACLRYIQFHRKNKSDYKAVSLVHAIETIGRLANHAAGMTRASQGYGYMVRQTYCDDSPPATIDYQTAYHTEYPEGKMDNYIQLMGTHKVVYELSDIVLKSTDIPLIKAALMDLYLLSGSVCYTTVLEVLLQTAGLLLFKLVYFLESLNPEEQILGDISLCILVQQATHESARAGLLATDIVRMLHPLVREDFFHSRMSYRRAIFVMISLCRVGEWRSYVPELLLKDVSNMKSLTVLMYMDLMKSIKQPPPDDEMTFGQLLLLDSVPQMCDEVCENAMKVGVKDIANFFVCPVNAKYCSKIPWDMASAGCVIISALVTNLKAAEKVLSTPSVRYIGNCLYQGYSEIANKELDREEADLNLAGCDASTEALALLCQAGKLNPTKADHVVCGIQESHAAQAANYFLTTFANSVNSLLPHKTKSLQDRVALMSVKFLERYTACLLALRNTDSDAEMAAVAATVGKAICQVLMELLNAFGKSPRTTRILDDICQLLIMITKPPAGVISALRSWKIAEALGGHLPEPMNNVGDILTEDMIYKNGLRQLPRSFFDVVASLCKNEQGRALCLSDGYLRRALDRVALTVPLLEGEDQLAHRLRLVEEGLSQEKTEPNRMDIASCLRLIALTANFNNPKFGSANDMILHPNFRIVELCGRLLSSKACPRDDSAFLGALKVLRYLAKDSGSSYDLLRDYNIVPIFAKEIHNVDTIPLDGIADIVDFTYNVAIGMKGKHIRKELVRMKDALTRVARVHFRLGQAVSDVHWAISRNHEGPDAELGREGPVYSEEIEELLRLSAQEDLESNKISSKTGTYEACGVGTCGSLRIPGTTCGHGEFSDTNPNSESKKLELCKIATRNSDSLEISKESARDPKLRAEVQRRKAACYMLEPESTGTKKGTTLPPVGDGSGRHDSPSSSRPNSQGGGTRRLGHSLHQVALDDTMPLWIDPSPKKRKTKKGTRRAAAPIPVIDVSELPGLIMTKPPPRPSPTT